MSPSVRPSFVGLVLTCVCVQLPEGLGAGGLDVADCADVVQTPAGHQVPRGGEGHAHHPGRLQGDGDQLGGTGSGQLQTLSLKLENSNFKFKIS